jgi:release factor glutamine methyltransferase
MITLPIMSAPPTIAETVRSAAHTLKSCSESPRLDAELLLGKVLGISRSGLIARHHHPVSIDEQRVFGELLSRRAGGEPVAYLTGHREFWSLPLTVSPAVLIPRPETECLVERALELCARSARCTVLDLGTGSGAIALAIASERRHWRVTAVDISPQALEVAAQNASALDIQIDWRLSDWFDAVPGERFDLIVANPPYVACSDPALVSLRSEPQQALVAGPTGLEALSAIIADAGRHLEPQGWLLLEHGATQGPQIAQLLDAAGYTSIRTYADFSGRPRITLANLKTQH